MKKTLLSLAVAITATTSVFAQHQGNWCGTDAQTEEWLEQDPQNQRHLHETLVERASHQFSPMPAGARVAYTIPVVFHVIHDNGVGNISRAQLEDALAVMNEDFTRTNSDANLTRNTAGAPFLPVAADCEITFELAKLDPNGVCTDGIVRVNNPGLTYDADNSVKSSGNGGSTAWPNNKYMNIWVVNTIDNGGGAGITLGYAELPYSGMGASYGIVARHDALGRLGTANSDGRTLTHEMGHALGLLHTFQGGWGGSNGCHSTNCSNNGDYVCDTPPTLEATFGCVQTQNTCANIPTNDSYGFDALDQIENYMSYDACTNMFSNGQKSIMVTNITSEPKLTNLVSASNLAATGVSSPAVLCQADFDADRKVICAGQSISFDDQSFNGQTSWDWSFSGGTPATSTSASPNVFYMNPGTYDVTLTVGDGTSNETETKTAFITVLPAPGTPLPYSEGFESTVMGQDWFTVNSGLDAEWAVTNTAASSGSQCVKLGNFGTNNYNDDLISPSIDMSPVPDTVPVTISFDVAYRKRSANTAETLKFYVSQDCGNTWVYRAQWTSNQLTSQTQTSSFTPSAGDWSTKSIYNVTSAFYLDNFRFKFEFNSDNGNNIFIDNINITTPAVSGIEEGSISVFEAFPNPASDQLNVTLRMNHTSDLDLVLVDVSGKIIKDFMHSNMDKGTSQHSFYVGDVATGMYMLRAVTPNGVKTQKVLIK